MENSLDVFKDIDEYNGRDRVQDFPESYGFEYKKPQYFTREYLENELSENIDTWVRDNLGMSFKFRPFQKETIIDICVNILEQNSDYQSVGNHNHVIEAPTGSGKSLINIISAGVLADYYNRSSYILASDLYLWKQYEDLIKSKPTLKAKFGCLKGQSGNYKCLIDPGVDIANADCKMAGISWSKMFRNEEADKLGFKCARHCKYVKERKKAMQAKVTLLTYQLWLLLVPKTFDETSAFKPRDIVFCDECHNIPSIVQMSYSPGIHPDEFNKYLDFYDALYKYNEQSATFFEDDRSRIIIDFLNNYSREYYSENFDTIWKSLQVEKATKEQNWDTLNLYNSVINTFGDVIYEIDNIFSKKSQIKNAAYTEDEKELYKLCNFARQKLSFWESFYGLALFVGREYILKTINYDRETGKIPQSIILNITREDVLVKTFVLDKSPWKVMTSATIGGVEAYTENMGFELTEDKCCEFDRIPSTFNFDKSPIYYLNRYKMSYYEKQQSFPKVTNYITNLCNRFVNQRGMIQTGTYSMAKEIYNAMPKQIQDRLLLYNNSREKISILSLHKMKKDSILIGPTLNEGIDFPDDQCRFIIIAKVPYPSIVDELVKEKIRLFPRWYNSTTSNIIIQGVGRGVRNENDYCQTFILDACFLNLYLATQDQYPIEFQDRIKMFD